MLYIVDGFPHVEPQLADNLSALSNSSHGLLQNLQSQLHLLQPATTDDAKSILV